MSASVPSCNSTVSRLLARIDAFHLRILALADAGLLRCARIAQHVAHFVPLGPGAIRAGEVLAGHQRSDVMLCAAHRTPALQLRMDALVDLHAGAIVGRDDQSALRRFCILFRNCRNALVVVGNLMDAALPVKALDRLAYFATCKLLDHTLSVPGPSGARSHRA